MADIRIVIIEDHTLTRLGLKTALGEQPDMACIGAAATGNDGLGLLHDLNPDVAIVDVGLPDIDGIEVIQQFKSAQKSIVNSETKMVVLTSHDSEEAVLAAFAAGADSYCMKDINLFDLMGVIRETYEGNPWIDPQIASIVLRQMKTAIPNKKANSETRMVNIEALGSEDELLSDSQALSERELQILENIVLGHSNAEIAETLVISLSTVKTHVRSVLTKLGVNDRTQAAVMALRSGLIH